MSEEQAQPQEIEDSSPEQAPAESKWYGELSDDGLRDWAKNKAYSSANEALRAHHSLEKFLGADKAGRGVVIPKDDSSNEEWGTFYDKIGRPQDAKGYEIDVPEGQDGAFAENMASIMYESGVPKKAAQNLAKAWNEFQQQSLSQQEEASEMKFLQEEALLKKEWGGAYDANIAQAKIAFREFGVEGDTIDALEKAMGFDKTMKFLHGLNQKIGDHKFIDGNRNVEGVGAMTPAEAQRALDAFNSDPENYRKLSNGDPKTKMKKAELLKYAYPETN